MSACQIHQGYQTLKASKDHFSCLTQARYGIAWGMIGAAVDCYNTALDYSKERKQFSKPIAGYQLTQAKFAEMITESRSTTYGISFRSLKRWGINEFPASLNGKNNCDMARDIAKMAREILGANGVTEDYSP